MKAIIILFFPILSFSQIQTISNQKTFGTGFDELLFRSKVYDGFLYSFITPQSSGISQDKSIAGFGQQDGWFVKMDLDFNVISESVFGGNFGDGGVDFVKCANGDFMLLLTSSSDISGNKTESQIGSSDYWLIRLNPSGNIVWQKVYGGTSQDDASKIIKISENRFLIIGSSNSPISGNKTVSNYGLYNVWSLFVDGNGNVLDQYIYGGDNSEQLCKIDFDIGSNKVVYGCSSFSGVSGNKTTALNGFVDGWVFTTDTLGNILNQKSYSGGSSAFTYLRDIGYNDNGQVFVALDGETGISGDKTVQGFGDNDAWLVILDNNLNELNQFVYGGSSSDGLYSMNSTGVNMILCIGTYSGISGNKSEGSYGGIDNWLVCLDPNGNILWQKSAGGNLNETEFSIVEMGNNQFATIGKTLSGISGNKTVPLYVSGSSDLWYYKLSTTLSIASIDHNTDVSVAPNPFDDNISFVWNGFSENVHFMLKDGQGKVVDERIISGTNQFIWSGENLPSGIYFYTLDTANGRSLGKIIKK